MRTAALTLTVMVAACASGSTPSARTGDQTVRVVGTAGGTGATQIVTTTTAQAAVVTIEVPPDQVFRALPAAYAAVGIEVSERDAARRTIGNSGFRVRRRLGDVALSQYVDCGRAQGGPNADSYEVQFSVMTEVQKATRGRYEDAIVSTIVDATARPVMFSGSAVRCVSTGELERRIAIAAGAAVDR